MDGLLIQITNYSSLEWTRNNWGAGAGDDPTIPWDDSLTQTPSTALEANNGQTVAAAQSDNPLVLDALYLVLGYGSSDGNFAVKIQQRFHLAGMGKGDEWQVWDGNEWTVLTEDSNAYTWTFKTTQVVATPTLTNETALVEVIITDLP